MFQEKKNRSFQQRNVVDLIQ